MIVTIVKIHVKEDFLEEFKEATRKNHAQSIREQGNLRFDFLQQSADPACFVLYEAYESEDAAADHKKTAHYLEWKKTVEDWMASPREGVRYEILHPDDKSLW